tara:strand:- start:3958 stop:4395 length:438 start_codon:yes stop_codon:yes gene_type:complete
MTDYVYDIAVDAALTWTEAKGRGNTVTRYGKEQGEGPRDGVEEVWAALAAKQYKLAGTIAKASEAQTFVYLENYLGQYRLGETILIRTTDYGNFFAIIQEVKIIKKTGDNSGTLDLLLFYVGSTSAYKHGFELTTFTEETNDWGI